MTKFTQCLLPSFVKGEEHIVIFETNNMLIAMRCWKALYHNKSVTINCHNKMVEDILDSNRTRDFLLKDNITEDPHVTSKMEH